MLRRPASAWLLALVLMGGCKHIPDERERELADNSYQMGVYHQQQGHMQDALRELQKSLELNPDNPEALNAMGLVLHLSFNRPEEAVRHYKRALEVRPSFSEAKTNLANVYLSQSRYDEAIKLYEEALNDMLYPTPFIAQGNLGWALYKKGDQERGVRNIQAALTLNPNFCMGYKNLGIIYTETGDVSEACTQFAHYRESCPEVADAYLREGACQAKQGKNQEAKQSFITCEAKAKNPTLKDDCRRLAQAL